VWLVPFQNARFAPPFVATRDLVASGRLGDVIAVRAAFGHGGPQGWAPDAAWFFDRARAGGGCLLDLGVHIIDVVRHVTGHDVTAVAALLAPTDGVERDAHLVLRLGSGALGTVHASWSSAAGPDQQLTVVGTLATAHLDTRTPLTVLAPGAAAERVAVLPPAGSPLHELLAAIRGEREPSVRASDGRAAVAVVEAAYASARTGTVARVP
jgi:predicted dehydrogenase